MVQSSAVYSYEVPSLPSPPSLPSAPTTDEITLPSDPELPDNPVLPEIPEPTWEEPTLPGSSNEEEEWSGSDGQTAGGNSEGQDSGGSTSSTVPETNSSSSGEPSGGQSGDGQLGDTSINTGDANNDANVSTSANSNIAGGGSAGVSDDSGGITVANKDNGADSNNSGSVNVVDNNNTEQENSANVVNDLNQESNSGDNSASKNVGNSSIETGDANVTGTVITAVNTNVDGVMVAEFNVVDDHVGDIILDYGAGCISGCGVGDIAVINDGNGADSTNSGEVDSLTNNNTFQENDATIESDLVLDANSGDNKADRNTGGDSTIDTGDANVAANVLTFANNNLTGAVVYGVVNIFGDLIGDIIVPEGYCCFGDVNLANVGNGTDSISTTVANLEINDLTTQFNEANIDNNLLLAATTGDNQTSRNTNGSNSTQTGDANVEAQVLNVANLNLAAGDVWLVIVNEAGNWIGKILGAPAGALFAGSDGFEFTENEAGEITVTNAGNGAGSTNTGTVNQEVNNTVNQSNTANIVNNLDLSANTGGNSTSRNTGGNNSITTGDAEVIANLINFVNNNIAGGGRLFVNVINVFGSWLGDFVSPGTSKENNSYAQASNSHDEASNEGSAVGGASGSSSSGNSETSSGSSENSGGGGVQASFVVEEVSLLAPTPQFSIGSLFASSTIQGANFDNVDDTISFSGSDGLSSETAGTKTVNINMAWLVFLIPLYFVLTMIRRRKILIRLLPGKRAND